MPKILYEVPPPKLKTRSRRKFDVSKLQPVEFIELVDAKKVLIDYFPSKDLLIPDNETIEKLSVADHIKVENIRRHIKDTSQSDYLRSSDQISIIETNKNKILVNDFQSKSSKVVLRRSCPSILWFSVFATLILLTEALVVCLFCMIKSFNFFKFRSIIRKHKLFFKIVLSNSSTNNNGTQCNSNSSSKFLNNSITTLMFTSPKATTITTNTQTLESKISFTVESTVAPIFSSYITTEQTSSIDKMITSSSMLSSTTSISIETSFKASTATTVTTDSTTITTTIAVTVITTGEFSKCENVLNCQNNGEFDETMCKCQCLPAFDGICNIPYCKVFIYYIVFTYF